MEGVWSVQQITLHWTSRAFANVTSFICLHLFHSEVHDWISSKLLTNFELKILIIFFLFQFCHICFVWFFGVFDFYSFWSDVRGPFFRCIGCCITKWRESSSFFSRWETNCWHFTTFQKICWKFILSGYFVCRQITAVLKIEILTNIGFLLVLKN